MTEKHKIQGWVNEFTVEELIKHIERSDERLNFLEESHGKLIGEHRELQMENKILRKLLKEDLKRTKV